MAAAGQMNIRMDTTLKAQGDAVIAAAGFSPSQAVRALWELALKYKDNPGQLAQVLEPDKVNQEDAARATERACKLALVAEWDKRMDAFYKELDISPHADGFIYGLSAKQLQSYFWYRDHQEELHLTDEQIEERVLNESL